MRFEYGKVLVLQVRSYIAWQEGPRRLDGWLANESTLSREMVVDVAGPVTD